MEWYLSHFLTWINMLIVFTPTLCKLTFHMHVVDRNLVPNHDTKRIYYSRTGNTRTRVLRPFRNVRLRMPFGWKNLTKFHDQTKY